MSFDAQHLTGNTGWFKSSYSNSAASCVEVRFDGTQIAIRDSKNRYSPSGAAHSEPILTVTARQWAVFVADVRG